VADLVIRNGVVADGTGGPLRRADVAVDGDRITAVGTDVARGRREIDADGLLVTPGFVDPHTHYDGQATWDTELAPSCDHGVTSVVMGNCGVGFAPVHPDRHDWLIEMMEGVEDIPGTALAEGLPWDWQSFPEYLDSLDRLGRTIDVGTHVPHAALRAYVMGERGADPEAVPSADELARMRHLVGEGLAAGAVGVSTSRTELHRTSRGDNLGTLRAAEPELAALAGAMRDQGAGVFQLLTDAYRTSDEAFARRELDLIGAIARTSGRPVSFTVQQSRDEPERWRDLLGCAEGLRAEGYDVKGQVAPRPIGVLLGLAATTNPFSPCRAYKRVAGLPLAERVVALRDPDRRAAILESHAALTGGDAFPGLAFLGRFDDMYVLDDPVDYALDARRSLGAEARAAGVDPAAHVYDVLLRRDGRQLVYVPVFNFAHGDLGTVREMLASPAALFGLSDAGAHCGSICDASMTTSFLSVWGRDRADHGDGLAVADIVHRMTRAPAAHVGWLDRGVVAPGYLADLNVVDLPALACRPPEVVNDLPAGGRRLVQRATGYRATVKSGAVSFVDGEATGERRGGLLRGTRPAPTR
jgi:N-acyl-D-aspartate/D-glutamate deacylase